MSAIPDDIMKAAAKVWADLPAEGAGIIAIARAILDERQRCADIAEQMKVKHGSPIMGPYENGQWDQGQRIASLISGKFPSEPKGGAA